MAACRRDGGGVGAERSAARAVRAADAAEAPAPSVAADGCRAVKGPEPGAGVGGERGWTRREEPARCRCPQQGSL